MQRAIWASDEEEFFEDLRRFVTGAQLFELLVPDPDIFDEGGNGYEPCD